MITLIRNFFYVRKKVFFLCEIYENISFPKVYYVLRIDLNIKKKRCTHDSKKSNHFKLIDWQFKSLSELFID